jgi:hypothetical protein
MQSDPGNYTPLQVPEGYVETENELGEKVWRLVELEQRVQTQAHWRREEFLMLKLSGLVSALGMRPRITLPALAILVFTVQRDRTVRQPLKITGALASKVGHSRYSLYRASGWLEANLPHFVTVTRSTGKATCVELTQAGRKAFHPVTSKGVRI